MVRFWTGLGVLLFMVWSYDAQAQSWQEEVERSYIKTVSRPLDTYHYWPRQSVGLAPSGPVDPQDAQAWLYLKKIMAEYWNLSIVKNYKGPSGIYVASDPVASREWGSARQEATDKGWSLFRLTVKPGTRFLDGRLDGRSRPFRGSLLVLAREMGCTATGMKELAGSKTLGCRRLLEKMSREMNVQALALFFYAYAPGTCGIHNSFVTDYVIFDPSAVENFSVFVEEIAADEPMQVRTERKYIERYFHQTLAHIRTVMCPKVEYVSPQHPDPKKRSRYGDKCLFFHNSYRGTTDQMWPGLFSKEELTAESPEYDQWLKTRIHGCQSRGVYPEDTPYY